MSRLARNIVSRSTLLALAALFILGGWKCLAAAHFILTDERTRALQFPQSRSGGGWVLPGVIGVGLMAIGLIAAAGALVPLALIHKIKPSPPRLHDNPQFGPINKF